MGCERGRGLHRGSDSRSYYPSTPVELLQPPVVQLCPGGGSAPPPLYFPSTSLNKQSRVIFNADKKRIL